MLTCHTRFGVLGSKLSSCYQEQNREGGKAQSGQYMAGWAGLLQSQSCSHGHRVSVFIQFDSCLFFHCFFFQFLLSALGMTFLLPFIEAYGCINTTKHMTHVMISNILIPVISLSNINLITKYMHKHFDLCGVNTL